MDQTRFATIPISRPDFRVFFMLLRLFSVLSLLAERYLFYLVSLPASLLYRKVENKVRNNSLLFGTFISVLKSIPAPP